MYTLFNDSENTTDQSKSVRVLSHAYNWDIVNDGDLKLFENNSSDRVFVALGFTLRTKSISIGYTTAPSIAIVYRRSDGIEVTNSIEIVLNSGAASPGGKDVDSDTNNVDFTSFSGYTTLPFFNLSQGDSIILRLSSGAPGDATSAVVQVELIGYSVPLDPVDASMKMQSLSLSITASPDPASNPTYTSTFTSGVLGGVGPVSLTWDFGDGSAIEVGDNIVHVFPTTTQETIYAVTCTATDYYGTVATQTIQFHVLYQA